MRRWGKAEKDIDPGYVKDGKQNQQGNKPTPQVPDVLRLQPLKFYGLVDAFVDLINAVCHLPFNGKFLSNWVVEWDKRSRTTVDNLIDI
jgi:hypothetical protein